MVAGFATRREDFPPHLEELDIQHVTLLVTRQEGFTEEIRVKGLTLTPGGETTPFGGEAQTISGVVSTRRSNGAAWLKMQGKSPVGSWELRLPDDAQVISFFKEGRIVDLALVITFGGRTPAWPT
jgi:hypothetical protein